MKERAKREKYIPSSFAEWLELKEKSAGNDARTYRYAANSLRGEGNGQGGMKEAWHLFLQYREDTVQVDARENMPDTPAAAGASGTVF